MNYKNVIDYLLSMFPELLNYGVHDEEDLELPYYVFGNSLFAGAVSKLIVEDPTSPLLDNYFGFIEEMIESDDRNINELAVIGFVESLTNDATMEKLAYSYMKENTRKALDDLNKFWNKN